MKKLNESVLTAFAESKCCSKCNIEKPLNKFHKKKGGKYGLRADCSDCVAVFQVTYREINSDKIKADKRKYHADNPDVKRKHHLRSNYNISLDDYQAMLVKQNYQCAICDTTEPRNAQHKHFYVDHCHKTNKLRGLLCYRCNSAIGYLDDSANNCDKAAEYLRTLTTS